MKHRQQKDHKIYEIDSKITELLKPENKKKFDENHILVLFKMYNYSPGIIYLCEQMNLREELLNYYIQNQNSEKIIELCT